MERQSKQKKRSWLPYPDARAYARSLGLPNKRAWEAFCQSGNKPDNIPSCPHVAYGQLFQGYGDWLGNGNQRPGGKIWRPYPDARAYARSLGLPNQNAWDAFCLSGNKPADIPSRPEVAYGQQFQGYGDWLGNGNRRPGGKRAWRPYPDARAYARSLGLSNQKAWEAFCQSGKKPEDIPSCPDVAYKQQFQGYADWLGIRNKWTKKELLALLQALRPALPHLSERELYVILQEGNALPALRLALGKKAALPGLQQILECEDQIMLALSGLTDHELEVRLCEDEAGIGSEDVLPEIFPLEQQTFLHRRLDENNEGDSLPEKRFFEATLQDQREHLHVGDLLKAIPGGLNAEAVDYLITNRVHWLWEIYSYQGREAIDRLLVGEEGGEFFTEIKRQFLSEVEAVEQLDWTKDWAFTVDGIAAEPNLMQRRIAWMAKVYHRIGNWSGVGAGKTISAILASRICDAHLTLIITNYATMTGWQRSIMSVYPNSQVFTNPAEVRYSDPFQYRYLILNYEQFQGKRRKTLIQQLLALEIEFITFDEIQLVKQGKRKISERSKQVKELLQQISQKNADIRIMGMSATPVVNSLTEAKSLLELITGETVSALGATPTIHNALMMHRALMHCGIRFHPHYLQEVHTHLITTTRNDLLPALVSAHDSVLALEQTLLLAKLDLICSHLRPGTLLYTHYVEGILSQIHHYLVNRGYSTGFYTGTDKTGLQPFFNGEVDILIGSSAVSTGLDGLQQRCNQVILLSLPWTSAAFEQIVGRVRRQGSRFTDIEIIVPQVALNAYGEHWSFDEYRWQIIHLKRTLSDCVSDGRIPEAVRLDEQTLMRQSYQALQSWIERVKNKDPHPFSPKLSRDRSASLPVSVTYIHDERVGTPNERHSQLLSMP